jgi:multisubunit Na+/H+ antiporter MnhB subunit
MYQSGDGESNTAITELYNKINLYKSNAAEINMLNDTIRDSKTTMLEEDERLNLENQQHRTTKTSSLVTIAIASLIIVFFVGIGIAPLQYELKRMYALVGLGIALVFCIIVYFVRKYKIEPFEADIDRNVVAGAEDDLDDILEGFVTSVNPDELQQYLRNKSAIDFERYLMEMSTLDHFARYLQNTINLALILQTSQTYNNINYSTSKELQYFNNTQTQVDNAAASLKIRHRLYDLESKKYRAGMMLAIAIVFIISIMTTLYVLEEGNVKARQVIMMVGLVAIVLSIMGYFLEVQSRVRTNADKYYWGKPSQDMLHQL